MFAERNHLKDPAINLVCPYCNRDLYPFKNVERFELVLETLSELKGSFIKIKCFSCKSIFRERRFIHKAWINHYYQKIREDFEEKNKAYFENLLWNKLILFVSLFVRDQILEPMNLKKELYPEFLRKAKQCEEKDDLVALVKKTFLKAKEPSQEIAQEKILPKDVIEPLGKKITLFLRRFENENHKKTEIQ